jgi:uncharacterized membrane protein YdbT with pleckstrin-like domain
MEEIVDEFRSSTEKWLFGSFSGWLTLLVCFGGLALAVAFEIPWFLLLSLVGVLKIGHKWLTYMAAKYEITSQRLIVKRGIIFKNIDEIELYRVKDVKVEFSLLNQLLDIGKITLISSDRTSREGPIILPDVHQARDRREILRDLVQTERVRRGVREIDYEPDAL